MGVYYPGDEWKGIAAGELGTSEEAVRHAEAELPKNNTVIGMMIIKDGYILMEKYNRHYGRQTVSQVFSVTKSVISALLGILLDKGLVGGIDDTIYRYFPEYEPGINGFLKKTVTIRHLLTMTAGIYVSKRLSFGMRIEDTDDWIGNIFSLPVSLKAANEFHYTDLYPHLISALIARQSGMTTVEFANRYLFDKIGISETKPFFSTDTMTEILSEKIAEGDGGTPASRWLCDPGGLAAGGFGLMLTLRDMARFGYLYLRKGRWKDEQLIPESWVVESTKVHAATGKSEPLTAVFDERDGKDIQKKEQGKDSGYGYYWWVYDGEIGYYSALGYGGQRIAVIPSENMVVAIKTTYSSMAAYNHADGLWKRIVLESRK
jgi:CubicO group peptidase (beta-lactamase class C family)